jgi:hypothetical protein
VRAANDTLSDIQVGDTFDLEDQVYEVVEQLANGDFRLDDGVRSVQIAFSELRECPRVVAW